MSRETAERAEPKVSEKALKALAKAVKRAKEQFPEAQSAIIPSLHAAMEHVGYIAPEAVDVIAAGTGHTVDEIVGVATFYHFFNERPRGKHHIHLCTNIACIQEDAEGIMEYLEEKLGVPEGEVTEDGLFSYDEAECIGLCDFAPACLVNMEQVREPVTKEWIDRFVEERRG